jgi:hypothetical protein
LRLSKARWYTKLCYGPKGSGRKEEGCSGFGPTEEEIRMEELRGDVHLGKIRLLSLKVRGNGCRNVRVGSRSFRELWGNGVLGI